MKGSALKKPASFKALTKRGKGPFKPDVEKRK